jgi:hypothetical protein
MVLGCGPRCKKSKDTYEPTGDSVKPGHEGTTGRERKEAKDTFYEGRGVRHSSRRRVVESPKKDQHMGQSNQERVRHSSLERGGIKSQNILT